MTPLAQAIANDACLPVGKRRFGDLADEIGLFDGLHFFECSAIIGAAESLARNMSRIGRTAVDRLAFLPATRVWLEYALPMNRKAQRAAFLLEDLGDRCSARIVGFNAQTGCAGLLPIIQNIPLIGHCDLGEAYEMAAAPYLPHGTKAGSLYTFMVYALLAMINTPRVINRQQNMPHRGLQRKLAASRGMVGKFPLKAWTELKLEVRPPRDATDDGDTEAHLTGQKALHFCRTHLRVRLGKLELVSAHWRGDPALGIKQTRYAVVPPKDGVWPKWAAQHGATP